MDNEKAKRMSSLRASLGTFSNFSQNDLDDDDDPISAYFKKRCANSSKTSFFKKPDSDSDSSLGLIDVDNASLFDFEEEGNELEDLRLSCKKEELKGNLLSKEKNKIRASDTSELQVPAPESELEKQRILAQKALKRLSNKNEESQNENGFLTPEKKNAESLNSISDKLMSVKLSDTVTVERNWLEPNFSPNTPRCFNDELSSFGGEYESISGNNAAEENNMTRESLYARKLNSLMTKMPQLTGSDLEFKLQTKEEQIIRFEEDEKKFKLENSGILHNSGISEFSGVAGDETLQWPGDNSNSKLVTEGKNLSIGQFFNIRSNRVSSLVGTATGENSLLDIKEELVPSAAAAATYPKDTEGITKRDCPLSAKDTPIPGKAKFRRCVSTLDLKENAEVSKALRYSSDSCSSNSTIMIQDILAEMESGLSGTQIYEKLIKSYGRREKEGKERKKEDAKKKVVANPETPKSSKVVRGKSSKKAEPSKEPKKLSSSILSVEEDFKENEPVRDVNVNESACISWKDRPKRGGKGFWASTPKTEALKCQNDKFKTDCGDLSLNCEGWEAPRVNLIQSTIDLNRSEVSEENDKTITVSASEIATEVGKKNTTVTIHDTFTIEDTIIAGDLTVLSQRIDEMKQDSVCIVRSKEPEEPVLLTVIQKLADLPKGTVDCSALTPLLRDQFPELLSSLPTPSKDSTVCSIQATTKKAQDTFIASPGRLLFKDTKSSWIKLPPALGLKEKLYACADLEKTVALPLLNISKNWLLLSVHSVELIHPQGKKLSGVKKNNEWFILDFVVISLKETIVPPDTQQTLKVSFKSKVTTKFEFTLTLEVKELLKGEVQTRSLRILINNVHPENYINVIPKDPINFGVIADQCFDQRTVQVSFDGICELPLTVYIEEDESISGHFILKPCNGQQLDGECGDNIFHHVFYEGEKQVLEFRVFFRPNVLLKEDSKTLDFRAALVLMLGSKTETDGVLRKIPVKGSVGFSKFLCNPACTPLVFRASEKGQSVVRPFPMKNVGSLPIAFSVWIVNKDGKTKEDDDMFVAPKSFYLSRNEEASIDVVFNAISAQNCTKRYMMLQIKPNGRAIYDVELIGIVTSGEGKAFSRTSSGSVSTKSTANSESVPIKLLTTTHALSWTAIGLEKEARQTFQIKSLSSVTTSVRITFKRNTDAFKLVNENGEKVHKMRKVLKPDCPCMLTVVFRPDVIGTHHTYLIFETNHSSNKKMILLNGIGGTPNLYMSNIKPDLNGCKILRLQHSPVSNEFESTITVRNEGRIPGFLLIQSGMKDFSLSHELNITPSSVVVAADSSVSIRISQKLKNEDLQQLLSEREISKVATICVLLGDEPSRLRIKKLVESGKVHNSGRLKIFTASFHNEQSLNIKSFKDPVSFETEFLKSLKVYEVAVVVERSTEICEPSILEDTVDEFVTFISTNENTVISTGKPRKMKETECTSNQPLSKFSDADDITASYFPAESLKTNHNKITKWLETLDCL